MTQRVPKNHPVKARLIKFLADSHNNIDDELIDLYVECLEFYQKMRKELLSSGLLIEHTNKSGMTNTVKNPLAIEITKTVHVLNNLLKTMGLTPAQQRTINNQEMYDEFERF